jgi:hypothetical protein
MLRNRNAEVLLVGFLRFDYFLQLQKIYGSVMISLDRPDANTARVSTTLQNLALKIAIGDVGWSSDYADACLTACSLRDTLGNATPQEDYYYYQDAPARKKRKTSSPSSSSSPCILLCDT